MLEFDITSIIKISDNFTRFCSIGKVKKCRMKKMKKKHIPHRESGNFCFFERGFLSS